MSTTLQDCTNGDDAVSISIISTSEPVLAEVGSDSKQLQRWLCASGLATLVMDAATAFYRPPHGVVFEQHRFAYYATLAGIFAAGLAKSAPPAGWPAPASEAEPASVVCASVVPLVAIIALSGFSVVMKG